MSYYFRDLEFGVDYFAAVPTAAISRHIFIYKLSTFKIISREFYFNYTEYTVEIDGETRKENIDGSSYDNQFSAWRFEKHKMFAERYIAANNQKILDDARKEYENIKMLVEGAKTNV